MRHTATPPPHVACLMIADGVDFVTRPVEGITLTFTGIMGDRHAGATRPANGRTPWHRRGLEIANTRHVSLVSSEECAAIAAVLGIASVDPALLGANFVLAGVPNLSLMALASRLQFPSGATLFVTEQNAPCRHPADKLATAYCEPRLATAFAKAAIGRRGLVAIVERAGFVGRGDVVRHLPPPAQVTRPKVPVPSLI